MFSLQSGRAKRARVTCGSWIKVVTALALLSPARGETEFPFKPCSRSDPAFHQCFMDTLNGARDNIADGNPEFALPPLRNHFVDYLLVEEGPQELSLRATLKNTTIVGFEDFVITDVKVDFDKLHMEVQNQIPKLNISGFYKWNGAILTLRVRGEGPFDLYMGNVNMNHQIDFEKYDKNGATHWRITNYNIFIDWGDYHSELKNLFSGNSRLGQYVNNFINRNIKLIQIVYRQTMAKTGGEYVKKVLDPFFERVPIDELFAP